MRQLLAQAEATLTAAGVASARHDARALAAYLLGVEPLELMFCTFDAATFIPAFEQLVVKRAQRIPLQHLLGSVQFGPVMLKVGPGVFIPRPETEMLAHWAVTAAQGLDREQPLKIADFCSGSGAIAAYLAQALGTRAIIYAVELSDHALEYTRANLAAFPQVTVLQGDVTQADLLPETMDMIISNPPYVPESPDLAPEVYHDPHMAVFSGADGLEMMPHLIDAMLAQLRPGGILGIEHDDTTQEAVMQMLAQRGCRDIIGHEDWARKPRFVTAQSKL